MRVTERANELGRSRGALHDHLRTLERRREVVEEQNGYRLSLPFLDIAVRI